jgi:hypothetical protein
LAASGEIFVAIDIRDANSVATGDSKLPQTHRQCKKNQCREVEMISAVVVLQL